MKKICFVTTVPITLHSFVVPFAQYLHEHAAYDITFICSGGETPPAPFPSWIHYIPVAMKRGISLGGFRAVWEMIRIFRRERFDMVQYSTPNAAVYAALAAWIAGVPVRKYHHMGFRYLSFRGLVRLAFQKLEQLACALSTDIECVSASNRKLGIEEGIFPAQKSKVILSGSSVGLDCKRFDFSQREPWRRSVREQFHFSAEDCVFGFVGRITRDKGVGELLDAFAGVDRSGVKLLLIGDQELDSALKAKLDDTLARDPRVICHEAVSCIEQYYAALDVLVLPSYREGFGMVVLEAEAMGVPVIVTDIPGPTDAMQPDVTGLVVDKQDVDALRQAMQTLADAPGLRAQFGKSAHEYAVERFEQKRLFQAMLEDRKQLLGEK